MQNVFQVLAVILQVMIHMHMTSISVFFPKALLCSVPFFFIQGVIGTIHIHFDCSVFFVGSLSFRQIDDVSAASRLLEAEFR